AALVILIPPPVRWRAEVVLLSLAGQIPDIELKQLLVYMMPGSGQWVRPLIETRNPHAVIRNVRTTPADIQAGATLFRSRCAECHAPDGSGGRGPPLTGRQFTHGESDWAVYRTIRFGIPNTAMGPHPLPDTAVWQLEAFVRSIDTSGRALGAAARGPWERWQRLQRNGESGRRHPQRQGVLWDTGRATHCRFGRDGRLAVGGDSCDRCGTVRDHRGTPSLSRSRRDRRRHPGQRGR